MTKEDFYEELKRDAEMEHRQEEYEERELRTNEDKFLDKFENEVNDAIEACREVKRLYAMYDYEFDIQEVIGDMI